MQAGMGRNNSEGKDLVLLGETLWQLAMLSHLRMGLAGIVLRVHLLSSTNRERKI
jgi:hypothetical protein